MSERVNKNVELIKIDKKVRLLKLINILIQILSFI